MSGNPQVPLRQLVTITGGGTPERSNLEYFGGDIPWVTPKDMKADELSDSLVRLTARGLRESAARLVPAQSVLIVVRSGTLKHSLPIAINRVPVALNQDMKALSAGAKLIPEYLAHYLRFMSPRILTWVRATTADNLPLDQLRNLPVPVPPLDEQSHIANVLGRANALRDKRRRSMDVLSGLSRSLFLEMFGNPRSNPMNWPIREIGEICYVRGGKRLPKGEPYSNVPTQHPYIRVTDLHNGGIEPEQLRYLTAEVQARISKYTVKAGDVIISIAGSIGQIAPVGEELDGANLTENAAKLVPRQAGQYDSTFLAAALSSDSVQDQIRSQVGQVTIGKLALFRIERLRLPLPALERQRTFSKAMRCVTSTQRGLERQLKDLDALTESLQASAFG